MGMLSQSTMVSASALGSRGSRGKLQQLAVVGTRLQTDSHAILARRTTRRAVLSCVLHKLAREKAYTQLPQSANEAAEIEKGPAYRTRRAASRPQHRSAFGSMGRSDEHVAGDVVLCWLIRTHWVDKGTITTRRWRRQRRFDPRPQGLPWQ